MGRGPSLKSKQARVDRARSVIQPRLDELDLEIASLVDIAEKATAKSAFGPAVQARSRASSLRAERERLLSDVEIDLAEDAGERLRRMRKAAVQEGSWTAASSLAKEELELAERLAALEAPPPSDPLDVASPQDLVEIIKSTFGQLPLVQLVQLGHAITDAIKTNGQVRPTGSQGPTEDTA